MSVNTKKFEFGLQQFQHQTLFGKDTKADGSKSDGAVYGLSGINAEKVVTHTSNAHVAGSEIAGAIGTKILFNGPEGQADNDGTATAFTGIGGNFSASYPTGIKTVSAVHMGNVYEMDIWYGFHNSTIALVDENRNTTQFLFLSTDSNGGVSHSNHGLDHGDMTDPDRTETNGATFAQTVKVLSGGHDSIGPDTRRLWNLGYL